MSMLYQRFHKVAQNFGVFKGKPSWWKLCFSKDTDLESICTIII